jgi:hypothetical protein
VTLARIRSAAKSSPVEHELVCPNGHAVELIDGHLECCDVDPPDLNALEPNPCEGVAYTYEMKDLVRSGRTRARQFTTYPKPEPFR